MTDDKLCNCLDKDDKDDLVTLLEEYEEELFYGIERTVKEQAKSDEPNEFFESIIDDSRADIRKLGNVLKKVKQTPRCD